MHISRLGAVRDTGASLVLVTIPSPHGQYPSVHVYITQRRGDHRVATGRS